MLERESPLHNNLHLRSPKAVHTNDGISVVKETRDPVRAEKITRLREQILQGTYSVTTAEVAKAIMRRRTYRFAMKKKEK
ncbi:MAG: flagellar biosynthesis anti-sigma factor FlgM [Candidatus Binatia bacterium]